MISACTCGHGRLAVSSESLAVTQESPLSCIVDGDRICELAAKSGVKDIVKMLLA